MACMIAAAADARADDSARFRALVKRVPAISSIRADIVQHIKQGDGPTATYRGSYIADHTGRFRIDYHAPERQVVLFSRNKLIWYFPEQRVAYEYSGGPPRGNTPGMLPLAQFRNVSGNGYSVTYCGRHMAGIFTVVDVYRLRDKKRNIVIEIWVDPGRNTVIRKTVKSRDDVEVMQESYSSFTEISGAILPTGIRVDMRTDNGIQSSVTRYSNIRINTGNRPGVFRLDLPPGVIRRAGQ